MRLGDERESGNIEDRRSDGGGGLGGGGLGGGGSGGGGFPIGIRGGGIGTIVLVLVALYFGVDPSVILGGAGGPDTQQTEPAPQGRGDGRGDGRGPGMPQGLPRGGQNTAQNRPGQNSPGQSGGPEAGQDDTRRFVAQVLATTEDVWTDALKRGGNTYQPPNLVLYSGGTQSACGFAQTATGPFYCPGDQKVYLDLAFFRDMERKLNAPGDFARAYVIAHEIGHHVQNQIGTLRRVDAERRGMDEAESNAMQVRIELQADCFAGVWANRTQQMRPVLEQGDIEEGIDAAAAVGDDRLQQRSRGMVVPESFTHGSSAQRVRWFRRGLEAGDPRQCDTFAGAQP